VVECFSSWCQLTWVVLDKIQRAVKRLYVCVVQGLGYGTTKTEGPLLRAKFHLLRTPETENFTVLLHDFDKICSICSLFQDELGVKICLDLLKWLQSYRGFKFRESSLPQFFCAP